MYEIEFYLLYLKKSKMTNLNIFTLYCIIVIKYFLLFGIKYAEKDNSDIVTLIKKINKENLSFLFLLFSINFNKYPKC